MRAGILCALLAVFAVLTVSGCSAVRPWERDTLARKDMAWSADPLESELKGHIGFSKEGALVGGGTGGGGCGCN